MTLHLQVRGRVHYPKCERAIPKNVLKTARTFGPMISNPCPDEVLAQSLLDLQGYIDIVLGTQWGLTMIIRGITISNVYP